MIYRIISSILCIGTDREEAMMQDVVKIAGDAMGGDNAPNQIVKGAIDAVNERKDIKVCANTWQPRCIIQGKRKINRITVFALGEDGDNLK